MSGNAAQVEPTFEGTWGVVVALGLVSTVLNGCITVQACTYFHKFFHRDHRVLKYTIAYIWFGCTTLSVCEFGVIHGTIIAGYYLPPEQVIISLWYPIALALGMTIIFSVQGVYVLRMYRFNRKKYLLACCCALAGTELGTGYIWVVRMAHTVPAWQDAVLNEELKWIIMAFFVASVSLDMFIATSMCYQLWRSRMMGLKRTRYLVDKLIRWTIQTGMFTSVVSLIIILAENLDRKDNTYTWVGISALFPNCYVIGLLALLNARTGFNELGTDHLSLPTTISLPAVRDSEPQ